ncbi:MAG TPA: HAMP domain-containing sensor histidine kinase [Bacteroidia bacterium]|jgi:two-component system phosphate regulon sensor histidine kinase PhoR|nr:HAMP domain-containing sensor histidine kinase [Bacteroidia bacterium]
MKLNRTYLFIAISSIALLTVLIIQVNWIFQTAKIKEELFNEKANMVLARTTEALCSDKETCRKMEVHAGKNELRKIDSLFIHYMKFYNFHVNYSFEVINPDPFTAKNGSGFTNNVYPDRQAGCYVKSLEEVTHKTGWELKLIFPEKKQFILAEMGILFITSVILILVVLIMFWRTILLLMEEKKISEHTTDFLNNMTHEFKTPLTNIALAGKMMVKDVNIKQEDKIKHYSGIILEENEKLRLQVEQVLSMTALERGEIPLQKTELDLHQLINDAVKCMSVQIENRQGDLKLYLEATNLVVFGDKSHLTNAVCNLIDNAIKYSREKPELSIRTSDTAEGLKMAISDNGIGIKQGHQKKVFDKFFRVPTGDIHDVKGFGLGLAYVKKIIELHGGMIGLQSEERKGTTFIITLPVSNV